MIKYDPYADSHAPKRFERTDQTGRWSPIEEEYSYEESDALAIIGGILAGAIGAFVIYLWVTF